MKIILKRSRAVIIAVATIIFGGVYFLFWHQGGGASASSEQVISKNGIHWHPTLSILIKGQEQNIPANIGLGTIHQPIHTHDESGKIHLEINGLVTGEETKLGRFFQIWGKQFNASCIFEFCNGSEGRVKMRVNDQENGDFADYQMRDGDRIEIKFE